MLIVQSTSRWSTVTGLWLGLATWTYAALASLELRGLGYDPTEPEVGYVRVPGHVPLLTHAVAALLALVLVGAVASLVTGRGRRTADALLAAGLLVGGWFLWAVEAPRPSAPALVAAAALPLALSTLLPPREPEPTRAFAPRLLLAVPALLAGWACAHELAESSWRLQSWNAGYWVGVAVASGMLLVAVLLPLLDHAAWRWGLGLPTLVAGLFLTGGGILGLREGYLVSGFEEVETGWMLGGAPLFLGLGLATAGIAAVRGRRPLAAGTFGAAVLVVLAIVVGVPEIRSGF